MFFKLSLLFTLFFIVQSFIEGRLVVNAVKNNKSVHAVAITYWLGLLWISIAATLYYKATRYKQSWLRQLAVFIISPIIFAPLAAIIYVALVLLPSYSLINTSGFSH